MPGFGDMMEIQERVTNHPDYPQLRADVEAAYAAVSRANEAFFAAQRAVSELWQQVAADYREEHQ